MIHLIIGKGTVGKATGTWLESHNESVFYYDKDKSKSQIKKITDEYDIYWICTPENEALKMVLNLRTMDIKNIIIRSTITPFQAKTILHTSAIHLPEFLKENTALDDTFDTDRVVIGVSEHRNDFLIKFIKDLYVGKPIIITDIITSSLIKLIANAWLSTQISFWNEIRKIVTEYGANPQLVADAVTMDKRISKYGSKMLGKPFGGKCLPKDLNHLLEEFKYNKLESYLLKAVKVVNDELVSRR